MTTLSFTESLKTALRVAQAMARENGNAHFSLPHLLRGILHREAGLHPFLKARAKDPGYMTDWAEIRMEELPKAAQLPEVIPADEAALRVLEEADHIRLRLGLDAVSPLCVLAALLKPNVGFDAGQLKSFPLREQEVLQMYLEDKSLDKALDATTAGPVAAIAGFDALLRFCTDKTELARAGRLDPVIGRERETRMVLEILGRRTKPNVLITGEPGVGKTALVNGLALRIAEGRVPAHMQKAVILELDLGALFSGASYKGEVEERLKSIIRELQQHEQAILFIDEMHNLLDPKSGAAGAAHLLNPGLAQGLITVIGATTPEAYRSIIEPEQAFSRRFEPLRLEEPDEQTAVRMLQQIAPAFAQHHQLDLMPGMLEACVRLARRYVKDRRLPDAAVDLLDRTLAAQQMLLHSSARELDELEAELQTLCADEALSEMQRLDALRWLCRSMQSRLSPVLVGRLSEPPEPEHAADAPELQNGIAACLNQLRAFAAESGRQAGIAELTAMVAHKTGIPMGKIQAREQQQLQDMEQVLARRVVGQDHAIKSLADAIMESRSGIQKQGQPLGSFFLLGPTGTGKTELGKAIAAFLFQDERAMIRFDMSEFKEAHSAALLYGAPPGYVGYEQGGMLVSRIRQQPYAVLLFDEIEKAHPSVFDLFLQILDEGKMHDRLGREGDFSNALILFTSNIGSEWVAEQFGQGQMPAQDRLLELMSSHFRPEFLARLTEVIPFAPIHEQQVLRILDIQMQSLLERLAQQQIGLQLAASARAHLARSGFSPRYGARQVSSVIRSMLSRPIARLIVSGRLQRGDTLLIDMDANRELRFEITTASRPEVLEADSQNE